MSDFLLVEDFLGVVVVFALVEWGVVDLEKEEAYYLDWGGGWGFSLFWLLVECLGLNLASGLGLTGILLFQGSLL